MPSEPPSIPDPKSRSRPQIPTPNPDPNPDPAAMERQQELKVLLKRWEAEFLRQRQRKPSQADIEEAPEETRRLYRQYRELKRCQSRERAGMGTERGEQEEDLGFWGSHLNRAPKGPGRGRARQPRAGISQIYGKKLKTKLGATGKEPPLNPNLRKIPKIPHKKTPEMGEEIPKENPKNSQSENPQNSQFFPDFGAAIPSENPQNSQFFPDFGAAIPSKNPQNSQFFPDFGAKIPSKNPQNSQKFPDFGAEIPSENPQNSQFFPDFSLPTSLDQNPPKFPSQIPGFFPIPEKFRRLRRNVAQTLGSLDPAWIQRVEESQKTWELSQKPWELSQKPWELSQKPWELSQKTWELSQKNWEFWGNLGRKRVRDGDGSRESKAGIAGMGKIREKEKSQDGSREFLQDEEDEEEKPKSTLRARAAARGNFVRLNLKRKSYSRASMRGKFLRKQVWKQKWRKKFGGGADVCFRCGGKGHWASECRGKDLGSFPEEVPQEKPLLTLEEAAQRSNGDFIPEIPDGSNTENSQLPSDSLDFPPENFPEFSPPPPMDPLYPPNPDGTVPDPPEEVLEALRTLGFDSFRPGQAEAIMRVLSGISTLLLLPTGSGKSLCYQLPAFLYHRRSRCICIVISPLISLMEDQVSGLPSALKAVCIHSNLTPSQREAAIQKVRSGRAQILLLSPESVTGSGFFSRLFCHFPPVAFACLDEAHCISQWSHNFRPAYLRVCKVLRERLGVRCFLGLTATATVATARDVAKHLGIPEGNSTIGAFGIPENLRLSVSLEDDLDQAVVRVLREWSREGLRGSVLVYCARREDSERLAERIQNDFPEGPPAADWQ
ncbi:ATP-dependent DNA helicase Q4, partial [Agelaius phoeniceus]|uniref:ATP-dependent DNA helicase Q4 n=1 Tax=Agelaius phoeniceus TaxID=39638 RepID=UPI004054EDBA